MENIELIGYLIIYLTAVFGVGNIVIEKIFLVDLNEGLEKRVFEFALGNIFFSLLFISLGIFGLLYKELLIFLYILGSLLFVLNRNQILKPEKWRLKVPFLTYIGVIFLVFYPLILNLFNFPSAWDSLAYHLTLPKLFLREHHLVFYSWFPESSYAIGIQAIFGFGELVGDIRVANLIVFTFFILITLYLLFGLRKYFPLKVLLIGTIIFLFRPFLYSEVLTNPFVDVPMTLYTLLSAICLLKFIQNSGKTQYLLLLITLTIFICLIKFTGIIFLLGIIASLFIFFLAKKRQIEILNLLSQKRNNSKKAILFCLTISSIFIYWLLRNYVNTGNPVYPYFDNLFKSIYFNSETYFSTTQLIKSVNTFPLNDLKNFLLGIPGNYDLLLLVGAETFYLIVGFIFSLIGIFGKDDKVKYLSILNVIFIAFLFWQVGLSAYRYFLPIVPTLGLIIGSTIFARRKGLLWRMTTIIIFLIVIIQLAAFISRRTFYNLYNLESGKKAFLSYSSAKDLLRRQDNYNSIEFVNLNLDRKHDKVLVVFDNRLYYFDIPIVYAHPWIFFTNNKSQNIEQIYLELKDMGITYVLESTRWGIPPTMDVDLYRDFKERYLREIRKDESTYVFRLI